MDPWTQITELFAIKETKQINYGGREREREREYDVVELKANGVGSTAESEDKNFVDGVSDDGINLSLFRQCFQNVTHLLPSLLSIRGWSSFSQSQRPQT